MTDDIFNTETQASRMKEMADQEAEEAKQRRINFNLTFGTREGLAVLKDISALCHPLAISYVPSNQFETAFREGERNVFLYILSQLGPELRARLFDGI